MEKILWSSKSAEYETPRATYEALNQEFGFTLDPCCTSENHKCCKYYTKEDDGLSKSWSGETVFCNPPYGREIGKWVAKCRHEADHGATVVMLIPARTDVAWFHDYIYGISEIRFLRGRLRFNAHKENAPFPSMVVVMRGSDRF